VLSVTELKCAVLNCPRLAARYVYGRHGHEMRDLPVCGKHTNWPGRKNQALKSQYPR
jgi:hypothetical protein